MRLIPLLLLLLMLALFIITLLQPFAGSSWLQAFAEAAVVGALADWFAVTALFRHPLGLPIPHTAIVKRRKDQIGSNLARFVADHFLAPDVLARHLQQLHPGDRLLRWLARPQAQRALSGHLLTALHWAVNALGEEPVREFSQRLLRQNMSSDKLSRWSGAGLRYLIENDRHQPVITLALEQLAANLHRQNATIRQRISEGSPWWLPGFVDDRIARQMLTRVETLLLLMAADERHTLRRRLNMQLHRLARELEQGHHGETLHEYWQQLSRRPEIQDYAVYLWQRLVAEINRQSDDTDSSWHREIRAWLAQLAENLQQDEAMRSRLNQWLGDALVEVISTHRQEFAQLISDTVAAWDGEETSRRIELQIGPDLQYIRINGTLVGGCIGLLLHAAAGLAN